MTVDRLLKVDDLVERWGVSKGFVYELARKGRLPTVKLGGRNYRWRLDAIEEFERNGGLGG